MGRFGALLQSVWEYLREVSGEKAYTRYCEHVRAHGGLPMSAQEFYCHQQEEKYSRPTRCC